MVTLYFGHYVLWYPCIMAILYYDYSVSHFLVWLLSIMASLYYSPIELWCGLSVL